jgi:hypothetical protein
VVELVVVELVVAVAEAANSSKLSLRIPTQE